MTGATILTLTHNLLEAYETMCQPICREIQMPQTAFDILMFLANHPQYNTARDIIRIRDIKANLVSINVDKLVREGYLERLAIPEDRRKVMLICTEKANPIIERGRAAQKQFFQKLAEGLDQEMLETYLKVLETMNRNAAKMKTQQED